MSGISRETRLNHAREVLKRSGETGAEIVEATPNFGGFRRKDAQALIDLGEAEWLIPGERARLKQPTSEA